MSKISGGRLAAKVMKRNGISHLFGVVGGHVYPIFEARCIECHGPEKQKGKLRLDRESMFEGKNASIVRGDVGEDLRYDVSASSTQSPSDEGDVWTHAMTFQLTATDVFGPAGSAGTTLTVADRDDERRAAFQLSLVPPR